VKTTIELPDDLLIAAKKRAAETKTTLKEVFERSLRQELSAANGRKRRRPRPIRWITVDGGLPEGLDLRSRERLHDWLRTRR
jgi:hypothetical protein